MKIKALLLYLVIACTILPNVILAQEIINIVLVDDKGITGNLKKATSFL